MRIAIIGAGFIGEIHAKAVRHHPLANLQAIVDKDETKARKLAETCGSNSFFTTMEELVNSRSVDAVVIGTPNYLHASQTENALKAGLHVLVEKPMALNVNEAIRMDLLSQEVSKTLMVAHCWRYDQEVNWLRNQLIQNSIGRVVRTKSYGIHKNWGPAGWFVRKEFAGGGALMDMGIHAIDTVRYLLGDPLPDKVYATLNTNYGDYDVDDTGMILVHWQDGVVSYIETGWWQPYMDGPEAATQLFAMSGYGSVFPTYLEQVNSQNRQSEESKLQCEYQRDGHCEQAMYDQQMDHFITSILESKEPCSNGYQGIINMKILVAAYQSNVTGQVIQVENT